MPDTWEHTHCERLHKQVLTVLGSGAIRAAGTNANILFNAPGPRIRSFLSTTPITCHVPSPPCFLTKHEVNNL